MAIQSGEVASSDEVMNSMGSIWNDAAQNLFNATYIGFDPDLGGDGEPKYKNLFYDTALSATYYSFGIEDYDFSSNIFADSWTGSGQSYGATGGYVYANVSNAIVSSYAVSDGTTPLTLSDGSYIIETYMSSNYSETSAAIEIWDGTTAVAVRSQSGVTTSAQTIQRLNVDKTGETAFLTSDLDNLTNTGIDLSTLNNGVTWYIRLRSTHTNSGTPRSTTCRMYMFSELSDSVATEFIIDVGTASETVTNLIPIMNDFSNGTIDAVYSVSVDNGINYEIITNATILRPINTGTQIKLKAQLTSDSSLNLTKLTEYAIKYNLY